MYQKDQEGGNQSIFIILTLIFLTFYSIVSSYLQHNHLPVHKSAVAIIVGIIAGFILFLYSDTNYQHITKLNDDIVYTILYPPMIFAAGFNLKKKAFVKNLSYISLFGILGTFAFFIVISSLLYWANQLNLVRDAKDINNIRALQIWQILLLSACFCSIDTISSQEAISSRKFPKLYSIVFGEGIIKDSITIVLFRSIVKFDQLKRGSQFIFYWYTPFRILGNFLLLVVSSSFQGVLIAFIVTYLFKRARFLLHNKGITETCVVFLLGFCIYAISQYFESSGIISVLVYGLMLNHYGTYNMSLKGIQIAKSTFEFTSIICEGLLFLIMGIVVWQGQWSNKDDSQVNITHSYIFTLCVFVILVIGRIVNVLIVVGITKLLNKKFKQFTNINRYEMFILIISGLVKGATPFALFSSVSIAGSTAYSKNQGMVLKTTIIIIIIVTSIFLNSLIPKIYKKPLEKLEVGIKEQLLNQRQQSKNKKKNPSKFHQLEEKYLKKFLIFNYQQRKQQIQKIKERKKKLSFIETLKQLGEEIQFKQNTAGGNTGASMITTAEIENDENGIDENMLLSISDIDENQLKQSNLLNQRDKH